jgi:large-conductance mechanosensitive channel
MRRSVPDNIYLAAEVVVLIVQLALVDAAYSGDWSRIGAITREQELFLQPIVNFIIVAHAILGVITAQQAQLRGLNTVVSGVKVGCDRIRN